MTWRCVAIAATSLLAAGCGTRAPRMSPVPGATTLIASSASEEAPVGGGGALAWQQSRSPTIDPARPRTVVYLRRRGRTVRVNPPGTFAGTGGIDGGRMAVQVIHGGSSRLALYDIAARRLVTLPHWINDGSWLWKPDIDAGRLLYGAVVAGTKWPAAYQVRLADLRAHTVRVLANIDTHAPYAAPGQLHGKWASWFVCIENFCNVDRENLATGRVDSPPNPGERTHWQMAPVVDARGILYFERTSSQCTGTELERWNGVHTTTALRFPPHVAYRSAYLDPATRRLYFDATRCDSAAGSDVLETTTP